jgi:inorganic pyrophosphatase
MKLTALPRRPGPGLSHVVVESPRGSTVKLKYDEQLEAFTLSRPLALGLRYPFDWGFVPSTKAADGDPVDALVLLDAPTYPGVVLTCRALGVLEVEQNAKGGGRERNDRIIAVADAAPRLDGLDRLEQLNQRMRDEIAHFFLAVVALTGKEVRILGWSGPDGADALIDK